MRHETSDEKPKRLAPSRETLRHLFALSGNQCAFPACARSLVTADGTFLGQLCHIEAAEPGGERFNASSTNEERRAAANLLLLCYDHHVITNDVTTYPVSEMRRIKSEHEARYAQGIAGLLDSVRDWTDAEVVSLPSTMRRWRAVLNYELAPEEVSAEIELIGQFAEQLRRVSRPARQVLAILIARGKPLPGHRDQFGVLVQTLLDVTGEPGQRLRDRLGELEAAGLAYFDPEPYFDDLPGAYAATTNPTCRFPSWADLSTFCGSTGIPSAELIVDLRFDLLDA